MSAGPEALTAFVLARTAEREARAAAAPGPQWQAAREREGSPGRWMGAKAHLVTLPGDPYDPLQVGDTLMRAADRAAVYHAVGNDPAHVLARCAADRQIIEACRGVADHHISDDPAAEDLAARVLALLALPDAAHRDYLPEWAL